MPVHGLSLNLLALCWSSRVLWLATCFRDGDRASREHPRVTCNWEEACVHCY